MSKLNKTIKNSYQEKSHKNFMGGDSWDISDCFMKLRIVAASSFFGEPMYYDSNGKVCDTFIYTKIDETEFSYIKKFLGKDIFSPACSDQDSFPFQERIEYIIDECLEKDVEKTLQIAVELRNVDIGNLTPLEALNKLYELQNKVKNRW